jgi:hypothetical protein
MTEGPVGAPAPSAAPPPEAAETPAEVAPPEAPAAAVAPPVEEGGRFSINEDYAATIFGLVLLFLVLAGIITGDLINSFVPTLAEVPK